MSISFRGNKVRIYSGNGSFSIPVKYFNEIYKKNFIKGENEKFNKSK